MFLENADQIIYSLALAFNYAVMLNGLITYFIPKQMGQLKRKFRLLDDTSKPSQQLELLEPVSCLG